VRNVADDGIVFLYSTAHTGAGRMRRKQIISYLARRQSLSLRRRIELVKAFGFDTFDYGWNLASTTNGQATS